MKLNPRHIWAVGRNYKDHALEMKAPLPTEPMIFLKAGGCLMSSDEVLLPRWSQEIHHELELVLMFDKNLEFSHIGLALDLTERYFQTQAKKNGTPWTLAKSFLNSCPVSNFISVEKLQFNNQQITFQNLSLELFVNNQSQQKGFIKDMIFDVYQLRNYILERFPVEPGDLLLTGTPAGVGPINAGDKLKGILSQNETHSVLIEKNWTIL